MWHVLSAPDGSIGAVQRRVDGLFDPDRSALRRWAAGKRLYLMFTQHYPSADR